MLKTKHERHAAEHQTDTAGGGGRVLTRRAGQPPQSWRRNEEGEKTREQEFRGEKKKRNIRKKCHFITKEERREVTAQQRDWTTESEEQPTSSKWTFNSQIIQKHRRNDPEVINEWSMSDQWVCAHTDVTNDTRSRTEMLNPDEARIKTWCRKDPETRRTRKIQ